MTRVAIVLCTAIVMHAQLARGQSMAVEVAQTIGHSTEDLTAAATQLRTFGDVGPGVHFNVEAAWAARSADGAMRLAVRTRTAIASR